VHVRQIRHSIVTAAAIAMLASACGGTDTTEDTEPGVDAEGTTEEEADETADDEDVEDDATDDDAVDEAVDISGPQAYTSLLVQGEPALTAGGDAVALTLGPALRGSVPFLVYNGTDGPVSRIEVSGTAVDGDGTALGSGRSQGIEPNVIPPDGFGFGIVFVGADDLPVDATIDSPAIDYTTGLGDFENIVTIDVTDLTPIESDFDDFTGTITNPHDIEVTGPISIGLACLDDAGRLTGVFSTFADRDNIEPGGTSTFTISLYGDDVACDGYLVGASGYTEGF
jgi:hypothetical protein